MCIVHAVSFQIFTKPCVYIRCIRPVTLNTWHSVKISRQDAKGSLQVNHRRRIKTEEKAKVVAAVGGGQIQFDLKKRISSYSSNLPTAIFLAWQGIEHILSPKQQGRPLYFLLYLSFFYEVNYHHSTHCRLV